MAQQIDVNKLKFAEAASSLAKDMITQAIEQSSANQILAQEALKQASQEITQIQNAINEVQSQFQAKSK